MKKLGLAALVVAAMAGGFAASKVLQQSTGLPASDGGARTLDVPTANIDAVDFALPALDGSTLTLSESDGRVRVLNFWATWCAPCRREIPLLKELVDEHTATGIDVVGLAVDEAGAVSAYAADTGFNYPIVIAEPGADSIVSDFGLDFIGLPLTLVVAPDRQLIYAHAGELKRGQLDAMLPQLAALASGELDVDTAREQIANH
ncbi:MAG: TlpA disulfide reductase family protein [Pseudomonadota bacterium]